VSCTSPVRKHAVTSLLENTNFIHWPHALLRAVESNRVPEGEKRKKKLNKKSGKKVSILTLKSKKKRKDQVYKERIKTFRKAEKKIWEGKRV